jgi:parallel beta-helix repeat protein
MTVARKFLRCDSIIKLNHIEKNRECGIVCAGANNFTRIERNQSISSNRKAGIKVTECATVSIVENKIFGNFGQGILLIEGTSGHIEKNEIFTNFKANLAFGGAGSSDTVVLNNEIHSGRAEGIFVIESGFALIRKNDIHDNADGVLLYDSAVHLVDNTIHDN